METIVLAQTDCIVPKHSKSSCLQIESVAKCMQTHGTSNRQRENVEEVAQRGVYLGSFPWQNAKSIRGRNRRKATLEKRDRVKPKFCSKSAQTLYSRIILKLHSCILILLPIILPGILFPPRNASPEKSHILSQKWQIDKNPRVLLEYCKVKNNSALFQNNSSS